MTEENGAIEWSKSRENVFEAKKKKLILSKIANNLKKYYSKKWWHFSKSWLVLIQSASHFHIKKTFDEIIQCHMTSWKIKF